MEGDIIKKYVFLKIFIIILFSLILISITNIKVSSINGNQIENIIYVPDNYTSNQNAIDNACSMDIIYIKPGIYNETIIINKPISLIGLKINGKVPIINGSNIGSVLTINADNTTIENIVIINASPNLNGSGIKVFSNNNVIENCTVICNGFNGISLINCNSNMITNCHIMNCSNSGVYIYDSSKTLISQNTIKNNVYGVYVSNSSNLMIDGNVIENNVYGIILSESINNTITNNNLDHNAFGFGVNGTILSHFTHNIDLTNTINGKPLCYLINKVNIEINDSLNPGYLAIVNSTNITVWNVDVNDNYQGLLIAFSININVTGISLEENYIGFHIVNSSNLIINCSSFINNVYGVMLFKSMNNIFYLNDFINNSVHVKLIDDLMNMWNSSIRHLYEYNNSKYYNYTGNYWSDYSGLDVNGDGIGNEIYIININNIDYHPLIKPKENYEILTGKIIELTFKLKKGWNLISIPLILENNNVSIFLNNPNILSVYAWNPINKMYFKPNSINSSDGYWILALNDVNITLSGKPVLEQELNLIKGWNLIGSLIINTNIQCINMSENILPPYYYWLPEIKQYRSTTILSPLRGYWVLALNNVAIRLMPS